MSNENNKRRRRHVVKQPPKQKAPHAMPRKNQSERKIPVRTAPEVVYLPPKPFHRSRFLLHLLTVVAVVLALLLGLSIFFKVENVEVSGSSQYTPWQIQQASGIQTGDQLLTLSIPRAAGKITNSLPYVKTARIGIRLPDTVLIEIVETRVSYALQDTDGTWWLTDSDGKILQQCPAGEQENHTVVTGVMLLSPVVGQSAAAAELQHDESANPVTVTQAQRLDTALQIARYLESSGIIGEAASMDVTNLFEIELWYLDKYRIIFGDSQQLQQKVGLLKSFVDDYSVNRPYERGTLDISDVERAEYESFDSDGG